MSTMQIERIGTIRCTVGEGPIWDHATQALYFVDLVERKLWRYQSEDEAVMHWEVPSMIGSFALRRAGNAIVALQDGIHALDLTTGLTSFLCDPQHGDVETQLNDGKVDPRGRFLVGSQPRSIQDTRPLGRLYKIETDLQSSLLDRNFVITNGPCWNPAGDTFYFSDSTRKVIYAYDYCLRTGEVSCKRIFAKTDGFPGIPDGATVDILGRVWVAMCGAGKIVCFSPSGEVERTVDVPTPFVSSVAFGGPQLDQLYFTSINGSAIGLGVPADEISGCTFRIPDIGAEGLPEPRFDG
ncbi:SMP-30/gluconolactonase/LRE family protein [Paraburkholderia sp. CNPSo 3281]|uniref:SMP-30/gluconolactonase/LRE family protein n=1 Tax=Paraburkholderia sp. CNPSo 3281 TaxID=2940933 RepID=UPI0020B71C13|nr:SMP-30/gluconolactonase/LRE family protein [Paraburkholderia sp. CNPSo 3281]MCP3720626.1 SMP-30/gluconolactonase/LRE family protein [Paraburkholderia sp. CNPSo 3281]